MQGQKVVLVVDYSYDWAPVFKKCPEYRLEQTEWALVDFSVESGRLRAIIEPSQHPFPFTNQGKQRECWPDAVLIRNFPMALRGETFRNQVMALLVSGVPCFNNATSILATLDRAWLYAELLAVSRRLPGFLVVPLDFYPNTKGKGHNKALAQQEGSKSVFKVGSCNAGFGKFLCETGRERSDLWSVLATSRDYVTEEPFIEHLFEYRLQCIGDHIRCFKRNSADNWKNNTGNISFEAMQVEPIHREWQAAVRAILGGLDIFALDVLRTATAGDIIIEINPSANGLYYEYEDEDCVRILSLIKDRLK